MAKYGINKAILVGNLGQDPELKHLDQGIAVCNFTMATSDRYKTKDGEVRERTEWHSIVMWRGLAETAAKYLKKGSSIYVEGRIITRSWEDESGVKKYKTEIEADKMVMLDSRGAGTDLGNSGQTMGQKPVQQKPVVESVNVNPDGDAKDLPF